MKVRTTEITSRLGRDFRLQAAYISVAVLVSVVAVFLLMEKVLTRQALINEAEYYWDHSAKNGDPLPVTRNMRAYLSGISADIPQEIAMLPPGFHDGPSERYTTLVSEREGQRLYLVFSQQEVGRLILIFGVAPLAFVLIFLYIALYVAYRVSRRAVSPIVALAEQVRSLDLSAPDAVIFSTDDTPNDEINILSSAMQELLARLSAFVERERNFTRDASHELRSPLTVILMAVRKLEKKSLDPVIQRDVRRITKAARDMEDLTQAFLLLAREASDIELQETISVNEIAQGEVEKARLLAEDKPVSIVYEPKKQLVASAPAQVIASVIGNLLRNGINYTDRGQVSLVLTETGIKVVDTGSGMSPEEAAQVFEPYFRARQDVRGHGVGMTIVKRLCDRFGWQISVTSAPNEGTEVTILIDNAKKY